MFGIDWNNDGKEDMLDDMLTYGLYKEAMGEFDDDSDDETNDNRKNGSCLVFMIGLLAGIIIPIAGVINLIC